MAYTERILRQFQCDGCAAQSEPRDLHDPDGLPTDWWRITTETNATHEHTAHLCPTCVVKTYVSQVRGQP